jgi:hypothetical protein
MPLYARTQVLEPIIRPTLVAALDGWVDAGGAATAAAGRLAAVSEVVATFDADAIFDFRARRPTLAIEDGRPTTLTWAELTLRRRRVGRRDLLVLSGAEPDYRWNALAHDLVQLCLELGVEEWISIGAIPAAVPHTRPVTILGTESSRGLLRGNVTAGPSGLLRVPAALLSVLEMAMAEHGIDALGYFAQIPHYVTGSYPSAAVDLVRLVSRHLDEEIAPGPLAEEARLLLARLDAATSSDEGTRAYVERLEQASDESRLATGDDLISEIEIFLRQRRDDGG